MNCPRCFSPLKPNQRFCENCGCEIGTQPLDTQRTMAADSFEPPVEQQNYQTQQPAEQQYYQTQQPAEQQYYQTQQPAEQQYQQPAAPVNQYAQQYEQYQQSGDPGTRKGNGSNPGSNTPLIVIIIVLAALVVGGIVFALIMIFGNKGDNNNGGTSSASQQTSVEQSSASSFFGGDSSSQSSQSSSFFGGDSSSQSSQQSWGFGSSSSSQSSQGFSGDNHTIVSSDGVELVSDPSIRTDDFAAQQKIQQLIDAEGAETVTTEDKYTMYMYPKGNAIMYEYHYTVNLTDEQKNALKAESDNMADSLKDYVTEGRQQTGVSDMVMAFAYLDKSGELICSGVCK